MPRRHINILLKSVTYAGQIAHGDKVYPRQHSAIIDAGTFAAAQARLASNGPGKRTRSKAREASRLADKIVDAAGEPFVGTHTAIENTRYRHSVSRALQQGDTSSTLTLEGTLPASWWEQRATVVGRWNCALY